MADKKTNKTDQIRRLTNKVRLGGSLRELEVKQDVTGNGDEYISFRGVIRCGESFEYDVPFRSFIKAKKKDGGDSKLYENAVKWADEAIPASKLGEKIADGEEPTMVEMIGSIVDNPFVSSDGSLVEATNFSMQLINQFTEYCAEIDLEGYVQSISDELKDDEPTGRKTMRLISTDIFNNALDIKRIAVPEDIAQLLEENDYVNGITSTFFIKIAPANTTAPVKRGGIGKQRATTSGVRTEWVLQGADPIAEDDDALEPSLVKSLLVERKNKLEEIKEEGYISSSDKKPSKTGKARAGIGNKDKTSSKSIQELEDDDGELPF